MYLMVSLIVRDILLRSSNTLYNCFDILKIFCGSEEEVHKVSKNESLNFLSTLF